MPELALSAVHTPASVAGGSTTITSCGPSTDAHDGAPAAQRTAAARTKTASTRASRPLTHVGPIPPHARHECAPKQRDTRTRLENNV